MVDQRARVIALLPAYQSAAFIQATLDSLSAQDYPDFRVIISVDVCSDNTYEVCLHHSRKDPRFTVLRQQGQRLGYVGNCNFLLAQAEADYVCFAFHDDVLEPGFIAGLADALDRNPEAILSYPDITCVEVDGTRRLLAYTDLDGVSDPVERGTLMANRKGLWWIPNRGLFRLQRARAIGGLKTHAAGDFSADWPWLFHMSLLGPFVRVPRNLCQKIFRQSSLSKSWEFSDGQRYEARAACLRELWNSPLRTDEKLEIAEGITRKLLRTRRHLRSSHRPGAGHWWSRWLGRGKS